MTEKTEKILKDVEKQAEKQKTEKEQKKIIEEVKKKADIEKSKKYSLKDAAAVNATVGFGDNYVSAYAIAMNATASQVGLLTSIPNLIAPLAQLPTSKVMEKTSRKKIFSLSILLESLMWLPIIFISFLFLKNWKFAPLLVVIFWTIYAAFGNFAAPAWISWMGDLVKGEESGKFFGLRNKIGGIIALLSMIFAGFALDLFKKQPMTNINNIINSNNVVFLFIGFSLIFFLAMFFRLLSRHYVLQQYEPKFKFEKESYFSFFQFVKRIPKSNYGKFALYISLVVLAANIAGPYYTLYILRDLKFSYVQFMLAINISAAIATFIFMTKWGWFSDKFGNIKTIKITAFMIPLVCFFWPLSIFIEMPLKLYFLIFANFISGFAWAGFNLAAGNFIFDAATPQKRGLCSAYSAILHGFGIVIGATIGSLLITHVKISFMNVIMFVSLISGVARYLVSFIMLPKIKEVRKVDGMPNLKVVPFASEIYNFNLSLKRYYPLIKSSFFKKKIY